MGTSKIITGIVLKMEQFAFNNAVIRPKNENRMANIVDLIRLLLRSSLNWVCKVCSDLNVPVLRFHGTVNWMHSEA